MKLAESSARNKDLEATIQQLRDENRQTTTRLSTEVAIMKALLVAYMPKLTFPIDDVQFKINMEEYVTTHPSYENSGQSMPD